MCVMQRLVCSVLWLVFCLYFTSKNENSAFESCIKAIPNSLMDIYSRMALQWNRKGNFTAHIFASGIQPHLRNGYGICIADELHWRSGTLLFAPLSTVFVVNSLPARRKWISRRIRYYNSTATEKVLQWNRNNNFTAHIFASGIQLHLLNVYGICIADELQWRSETLLFAPLSTVFVVNSLPAQRKWISRRIRYYNNSTATFRLLLVCGDVEIKPGPNINRSSIHNRRKAEPRCRQCEKPVAKNRCVCTECFDFIHAKCTQDIDHKIVSSSIPKTWVCPKCIGSFLPFHMHNLSLSDEESLASSDNEVMVDIHLEALNNRDKQMKIMHINTQSMISTFDGLLMTLRQYPFHVISMSETWLKNNPLLLQHVNIAGYCNAFRNRDKIKGGGVGVYVKETIKFKRRTDIENRYPKIEHLWIELPGRNKNSKMLLGTIYRSQSQMHFSEWLDTLEDLLFFQQVM